MSCQVTLPAKGRAGMCPRSPVFTTPEERKEGRREGSGSQPFPIDDGTRSLVAATAGSEDEEEVTALAGEQAQEPPGRLPVALKPGKEHAVWHPEGREQGQTGGPGLGWAKGEREEGERALQFPTPRAPGPSPSPAPLPWILPQNLG